MKERSQEEPLRSTQLNSQLLTEAGMKSPHITCAANVVFVPVGDDNLKQK